MRARWPRNRPSHEPRQPPPRRAAPRHGAGGTRRAPGGRRPPRGRRRARVVAHRGPLVDGPSAAPALLGGRDPRRPRPRRLPRAHGGWVVPPPLTQLLRARLSPVAADTAPAHLLDGCAVVP